MSLPWKKFFSRNARQFQDGEISTEQKDKSDSHKIMKWKNKMQKITVAQDEDFQNGSNFIYSMFYNNRSNSFFVFGIYHNQELWILIDTGMKRSLSRKNF